jgi:hypothetical protein
VLAERVAGVELLRGVGSVSLVGVGVGAEPAQLSTFLEALGNKPLLLLTSPLRCTAVLPEAALGAAETALHGRL